MKHFDVRMKLAIAANDDELTVQGLVLKLVEALKLEGLDITADIDVTATRPKYLGKELTQLQLEFITLLPKRDAEWKLTAIEKRTALSLQKMGLVTFIRSVHPTNPVLTMKGHRFLERNKLL